MLGKTKLDPLPPSGTGRHAPPRSSFSSVAKAALLLGVFVIGVIATPSAAFAQSSGYAPTPPAPSTPTGVSGVVVSTCTVQPSGGPCSATVNGCPIAVTFPPGDFTIPTQLLFSSGVTPTGVSGSLVCAFGLSVVQNGAKITGTFSPPASINITSGAIRVGDTLEVISAGGAATVAATATTAGSITATFASDPNFAVIAPVAAVPSATTPVTGKPFALEELVAAALVSVGVFGLVLLRLKRRVRTS
jgi:hypothetical protein